jgi:hypothetical protein
MSDVDLSFEDLTFGGDETQSKKQDPTQTANQSSPNSVEKKENSKQTEPLNPKEVIVESSEPQPNVLLVSTVYGGKLNFPSLIKLLEEKCGAVKAHSHRENQHFCFVQFEDSPSIEIALQQMQTFDLDGYKINGKRQKKRKKNEII